MISTSSPPVRRTDGRVRRMALGNAARRRIGIVSPWVYFSVGGLIIVGSIIAAGLDLVDIASLGPLGALLLVAGFVSLTFPIPPHEDGGKGVGDVPDDPAPS